MQCVQCVQCAAFIGWNVCGVCPVRVYKLLSLTELCCIHCERFVYFSNQCLWDAFVCVLWSLCAGCVCSRCWMVIQFVFCVWIHFLSLCKSRRQNNVRSIHARVCEHYPSLNIQSITHTLKPILSQHDCFITFVVARENAPCSRLGAKQNWNRRCHWRGTLPNTVWDVHITYHI